MKLLFCPECQDILKLGKNKKRKCACGKSAGKYLEDGYHAVIYGKAVPIGLANSTFITALIKQPREGIGSRFEAYVIPKKCDTVKVEK